MPSPAAADTSDLQLARRPEIHLNVDLSQMGIGGIDSWSALAYPLEPYRITGNQPFRFSYVLAPVRGRIDAIADQLAQPLPRAGLGVTMGSAF